MLFAFKSIPGSENGQALYLYLDNKAEKPVEEEKNNQ